MNIAIGADHAGYELKSAIVKHLHEKGHQVNDFGTNSADSVDYPDFGHPVATEVQEKHAELGIVICGSGNGINMSVNKHQGVRSALCWNAEVAELARQHNDANILALPSRYINENEAIKIVDAFLNSEFEGGRHERRVKKISV